MELLKIIFSQNFLSANIVGQIKHVCTELYSQAKAYLCHVRKIIVSKRYHLLVYHIALSAITKSRKL